MSTRNQLISNVPYIGYMLYKNVMSKKESHFNENIKIRTIYYNNFSKK